MLQFKFDINCVHDVKVTPVLHQIFPSYLNLFVQQVCSTEEIACFHIQNYSIDLLQLASHIAFSNVLLMSVNCDVYSKMELCRSLSSISKLLPRVLELTEFCCSFLQVDRAQIRAHLRDTNNHDPDGNAWCHLDGCIGTYTAYRLNIWGLQATAINRRAGKDKVAQQVVKS